MAAVAICILMIVGMVAGSVRAASRSKDASGSDRLSEGCGCALAIPGAFLAFLILCQAVAAVYHS